MIEKETESIKAKNASEPQELTIEELEQIAGGKPGRHPVHKPGSKPRPPSNQTSLSDSCSSWKYATNRICSQPFGSQTCTSCEYWDAAFPWLVGTCQIN